MSCLTDKYKNLGSYLFSNKLPYLIKSLISLGTLHVAKISLEKNIPIMW